jgi:hypothetical protein
VYVIFFSILLVTSVFSGLLVSTENFILIAVLFGLLAGVALLAFPVGLLILVLLGGIVFSGLAEMYMPVLRHIRWAAALGAVALALIALFKWMQRGSKNVNANKLSAVNITPWIVPFWIFALLLVCVFSGLLNTGLSIETLVGLKGYFQVTGILLAFYFFGLSRKLSTRFFLALIPLALLQIPFAMHQYFFLLPTRLTQDAARHGVVAPDVVVGTFIGTAGGGGGNAILASLQVMAICLLLALWLHGRIKLKTAFIVSIVCVVPVVLNESKIMFVMLPLVLGWMFRDFLLKHTFKFMAGILVLVLFLAGMFLFYAALPRAQGKFTPEQYFSNSMRYNIGSQGYGTLKLNRSTIYPYWLDRHGANNIPQTLIGHGPGSSIEGNSGISRNTLAGEKYAGVGIGLTSGSSLLWELGILGLGVVIALHWAAFVQAGRLVKLNVFSPTEKATLVAAQAAVIVLFLNLPHNNYFVFEIGYQTLQFLIFGYIAYSAKTAASAMREQSP